MAISDTITSMYDNVGEVYDTITNVDLPTNKNIQNIPSTMRSSYLEIMNNGIDKIWNNWEKVTGEGETLTLNSTEEAPMKIDLKGNTSQEGTPTPEAPQDVHVVSGDNTIKVANGDNTEYEEYPISLGEIELCKIGDYQDYIYKDNDKWYLHKEIGKVVLNGSESWAYDSPRARFFSTIYSTDTMLRGQGLCNYYKYGDSVRKGCFDINFDKKTLYMFNPDSSITTSIAFKTWLGTNKPIVYYVLVTPTTTEITDTTLQQQLNALEKARSYNSQTNISQENNDKPFILDVTALKQLTQ